MRAPLNTCRGRAVGLLHDWQGGYVKTVSRYGKRVQHSKACNRPRPFGLRPNPPATFVEPPWPVRIDLLCFSMVFLRSNKCQSAPIT